MSEERETLEEARAAGRRVGRPELYTRELSNDILLGLMLGFSLRSICDRDGMPSRPTVYEWILENQDGFADRYARAREVQAEGFGDELVELSDRVLLAERKKIKSYAADPKRRGNPDAINDEGEVMDPPAMVTEEEVTIVDNVDRSRLMVETRKWYIARILHRKFGDKVDVNHGAQTSLEDLVLRSYELAKGRVPQEPTNG